jgi:hypothetical protein
MDVEAHCRNSRERPLAARLLSVAEPEPGSIETLLMRVEESRWDAIYRVAIGWLTYPALAVVCGEDASAWAWLFAFLGILFALRVVPAFARKVLPFSAATQATWSTRRQLAKRYDSYQWQKLFWIGLGLALFTAHAGGEHAAPIVLASVCLASGGLGLAFWRMRKPHAAPTGPPQPQQARGLAS